MNATATIRISRPIDEVWGLIADDFTSIARWSASVITSNEVEKVDGIAGCPQAGRYCTFTDDPDGFGALEMITKYDRANYHLEFEVEPRNAPALLPLKKNYVSVDLKALGPEETEVTWVASPELKAHGYLMYPMLKLGLPKTFKGILTELKEYAEKQPRADLQPAAMAS